MIDTSFIYDRSIKIIDDSYRRLLKIRRLPQGTLSTKKKYFYWRYYQNNQLLTKKITHCEWQKLKKKFQQRQKLLQMNKNLAIFNKELSFLLNDELIAYRLDSIPISKRSKVITDISINNFNFFLPLIFRKYFNKWVCGKIRARSVVKNLLIKTAN